MDNQNHVNENEQLELEEQAINEPALTVEQEGQLTEEKLREEADGREEDIAGGWNPEL